MRRRLLGLLAVVAAAGFASAQPPPEGEDPGVIPAQFTEPLPTPGRTPAFGTPPQPPTPVVQVQVLAPRDATDGKDIEYTVRVVNQSAGRANYVRVRVPFPEGAAEVLSMEPKATGPAAPGSKDLVWDLGTMDANSTQTLTFKVRPAPNKSELRVRAYVRFEHGQQVVTKLSAPKLTVKAEAAKTASADAPVPVRLTVVNNGRVPAADAKLTVNISEGFEFTNDDGGEPTQQPNQRVWDLGTLQPGAVRTHTLRITPKAGRNLLVSAVANSANTAQDKADVSVKVLESGLKLILDGDPKAVGGVAKFSATVRNTGGMPLTNVRVTGTIPDDCRLVKKTDGGRQTPTAVEWVIPKLPAGEEYQVRWSLECAGSGRRVVKGTATAGALEDKGAIDTVFEGAAFLGWKQTLSQGTVAVDQQAVLTVTVSNTGSEPAKDVRLTIDLPAGVSDIQHTPQAKRDGRRLAFPPVAVPAGRTETFTLTVRGETAGPAYFEMQLAAEALGGTPLTARKAVEVTGRR